MRSYDGVCARVNPRETRRLNPHWDAGGEEFNE
jgi:hypothetical protein